MEQAAQQGLNIIGFSEHGFKLTYDEWGTEGNIARTGGPIALRGFEWTGEDHINVFGTTAYCDERTISDPSMYVTGADPTGLYNWLRVLAQTDPSQGAIVAQFNHISWRRNPLSEGQGELFNVFEWRADVNDLFCLAEIGYGEEAFYFGPRETGVVLDWEHALTKGWHVAPTIGIDNQSGVGAHASSHHTGVWLNPAEMTGGERAAVMKALRARRVFASEDRNASVRLLFRPEGDTSWHWMGETARTYADEDISVRLDLQNADVYSAILTSPTNYAKLLPTNGNSVALSASDIGAILSTDRSEKCLYARIEQYDGDLIFTAPFWIAVDPHKRSVLTVADASVWEGQTVAISASLVDHHGVGLPDRTLVFTIGTDAPRSVLTGTDGRASVTYTAPWDPCDRTKPIVVDFSGDGTYISGRATATLTLRKPNESAIRVRTTGNDANSGYCWGEAKRTIQGAANAAGSGGEIWLAGGTYNESATPPFGCTLLGGFAGNEATSGARDPAANLTYISVNNAPYALSCGAGAAVDGVLVSDAMTGITGSPGSVTNNTFDRCSYGVYFASTRIVATTVSACVFQNGGGLFSNGSYSNITVTGSEFRDGAGIECAGNAVPSDPAVTALDTGGFEGNTLGSIAGQNAGSYTWQDDSSASQPTPSVFEDAFTIASGHNKVLAVNLPSLYTNAWSGVYLPLGDLYAAGMHQIPVEFDQFRGTLNQSAFILEAPGPSHSASSYVAHDYGLDGSLYPTGNVGDYGIPITAGAWQHVKLLVDFDTQTVSASVDGRGPGTNPQHFDLGMPPVKQFRGLGFRVYGTNLAVPNGPNYIDNLVIVAGQPVPDVTITNNTFSDASLAKAATLKGAFGAVQFSGNQGLSGRAAFHLDGVTLTRKSTWGEQATVSYVVPQASYLTVWRRAALSLPAGAVVQFGTNSPFNIDGSLHSAGAAERPSILTSTLDDSPFGGADGASAISWAGLVYASGTFADLNGIVVRHAGRGVTGSPVLVAKAVFDRCDYGVYFDGNRASATNVSGCAFLAGSGLRNEGTGQALTVTGNTFHDGAQIDCRNASSPDVTVTNNSFYETSLADAASFSGPMGVLALTSNQGIGGRAAFSFIGVSLTKNNSWTQQPTVMYIVPQDTALTVVSGASLSLTGGTTLQFGSNSSVVVNGNLLSYRADENPVLLTSVLDGSPFGGADGASTSAWSGLVYGSGTTADLQGFTVRHAAKGVSGSPSLVDSATFDRCQHGVFSQDGGGTVMSCSFTGNGYGVYNASIVDVDARYNWWGHISGPYHPAKNPGGKGDPVSDHVIFSPWYSVADVVRALRIASGITAAAGVDLTRLDVQLAGTSARLVDLQDAARLMRMATGID